MAAATAAAPEAAATEEAASTEEAEAAFAVAAGATVEVATATLERKSILSERARAAQDALSLKSARRRKVLVAGSANPEKFL